MLKNINYISGTKRKIVARWRKVEGMSDEKDQKDEDPPSLLLRRSYGGQSLAQSGSVLVSGEGCTGPRNVPANSKPDTHHSKTVIDAELIGKVILYGRHAVGTVAVEDA